jgi:hypothetical protein
MIKALFDITSIHDVYILFLAGIVVVPIIVFIIKVFLLFFPSRKEKLVEKAKAENYVVKAQLARYEKCITGNMLRTFDAEKGIYVTSCEHNCVYEFVVNGKTYKYHTRTRRCLESDIPTTKTIYYDPANPKRFVDAKWIPNKLSRFYGAITAWFISFCIMMVLCVIFSEIIH